MDRDRDSSGEPAGGSWRSRLRTGNLPPSFHVGLVVAAAATGTVLQFAPQLGLLALVAEALDVPLGHMMFEGALAPWYTLPVAYAALTVGRRAALATLLLTLAVLAAHIYVEQSTMERALLSLHGLTAVTSSAVIIWLAEWWRAARGQALAALRSARESEEQHRVVLEAAADAIVSVDSRGAIIAWNRAARAMFGYGAAEVLGKPVSAIMPARYVAACEAAMRRVAGAPLSRGGVGVFHGLRKDGSEFPIELSVAAWQANSQWFYTSIIRDVTERQRTQEALASEAEASACLYRAAEAMVDAPDEAAVLRVLADTGLREFGADLAYVGLRSDGSSELENLQVLHRGTPFGRAMEALLRKSPLRTDQGAVGHALTTQSAVLVADYARFPHALPAFIEAGLGSGLLVPLRLEQVPFGLVGLAAGEAGRFTERQAGLLQAIADGAAVALTRSRALRQAEEARRAAEALAREVQEGQGRLTAAYDDTVASLVRAVEARDPYTRGHGDRVRGWTRQAARRLGYPEAELDLLAAAAELHDIGKIGISDLILLKPAALTPGEMAEVGRHPEIGAELVRGLPDAAKIMGIVRAHHERWDGKGYPDGLEGEHIPWGARILAVPDTYDAMTTDRPYRRALTHEAAVAELRQGAGTQFDPASVEAFIRLVAEGAAAERAD